MRFLRHFFELALPAITAHTIAVQPASSPPPTMTVCELLRAPSTYNHKMIAIRGLYVVGGHATFLGGVDCEGVVVTKGLRWPSLVYIAGAREEIESHGMTVEHLGKVRMQIALAKSSEAQIRGEDQERAKVVLTLIGRFETRDTFDADNGKPEDGTPVETGFGDGAPGAPGQLCVDSVKDIVVTFDKTPPPNKSDH